MALPIGLGSCSPARRLSLVSGERQWGWREEDALSCSPARSVSQEACKAGRGAGSCLLMVKGLTLCSAPPALNLTTYPKAWLF